MITKRSLKAKVAELEGQMDIAKMNEQNHMIEVTQIDSGIDNLFPDQSRIG